MWSVKDMFYGEAEPVWIMNDNKKPDNKSDRGGSFGGPGKKGAAREADDFFQSGVGYYDPYYYPECIRPSQASKRVESKPAAAETRKDSYFDNYYYPEYTQPRPAPRREESRREESKAIYADQNRNSNSPAYPPYYSEYGAPPPASKSGQPKGATGDQRMDTRVVLTVPICCGECAESIETALYQMRGVKSVQCDTRKERVSVMATPGVAPADILSVCRKVFKKSKFWTEDDY